MLEQNIVTIKTPKGDVDVAKFLKDGIAPYSPSFIMACIKSGRPWNGTPHVTSIIGDLKTFVLDFCVDQHLDAGKQVAHLTGTGMHAATEEYNPASEIKFKYLGVTGSMDDPYFMDGKMIINDLKTSGSYKVAAAMGFIEGPKVPDLYDDGSPKLYARASGANKKGDPKYKKSWVISDDPKDKDNKSFSRQLNVYRIGVEAMLRELQINDDTEILVPQDNREAKLAFLKSVAEIQQHVDELHITYIPRDGGTHIATGRGITERIYQDKLTMYTDEIVVGFIKKRALVMSETMAKLESLCNARECKAWELPVEDIKSLNLPECEDTWGGRKCTDYCAGHELCSKLARMIVK